MNYKELHNALQSLIKRKIAFEEIGKILGCGRANIGRKINNKSEVTVADLLKLEYHYGIEILPRCKSTFLKRKKPLKIDFSSWGLNFEEVPAANRMTLSRFSADTNIEYDTLTSFVHENKKPTIDQLAVIIANYDVTFEDLFCKKEDSN